MKTNEAIDVVRNALDDLHIRYDYNAETRVIRTTIPIDCKIKHINFQIDFQDAGINFFAIPSVSVDKKYFEEMRKYLSWASLELAIGSFNMISETSTIFFKYSLITLWSENLPLEMIREIIINACNSLYIFGDGMATIALGLSDAETEFAEAKAKKSNNS